MKQTPLQMLIEQLTLSLSLAVDAGSLHVALAYQDAIKKAKSLLPYEREVIEEAHDKATENYEKGHPQPILSGSVYYTQTFTDESKSD